jgi:hypothetical protein
MCTASRISLRRNTASQGLCRAADSTDKDNQRPNPMTTSPRALAALALGLITLTLTLTFARAQAQTNPIDAQARAGFILNFARYVEWPSASFVSRDAPIWACLLERETLLGALIAFEGRLVQGRPLKVRRSLSADDTQGCHLVFIGEAEERRILPLLRTLANQPVLTVGDAERFVDLGGAIGIVPGEERWQFEINRTALDQAQLKAGAGLLKLARSVIATGAAP